VPSDLEGRVFEVFVGGNVVPVEHGNRFVSADPHRDDLIHVRSSHVPNRGPSEIMTNGFRESRPFPGRLPGGREIL